MPFTFHEINFMDALNRFRRGLQVAMYQSLVAVSKQTPWFHLLRKHRKCFVGHAATVSV